MCGEGVMEDRMKKENKKSTEVQNRNKLPKQVKIFTIFKE